MAAESPPGMQPKSKSHRNLALVCTCLITYVAGAQPSATTNPITFDFTKSEVTSEWGSGHDISALRPTRAGLEVTLTGEDPYFIGPARDYPDSTVVQLRLRFRSEAGGSGQIFFFRDLATERQSIRFHASKGGWQEVTMRIPTLGSGYRFRLDPPGQSGKFLLASLTVTPTAAVVPPAWPKPNPVATDAKSPAAKSGSVELVPASARFGDFEVRVDSERMAIGNNRPLIGYLHGNAVRWTDVNTSRSGTKTPDRQGPDSKTQFSDEDGATWKIHQEFRTGPISNAISVRTTVSVDQDRTVVFLPLLTLFAGTGTFGTNKHQGLFAGLEYLGNEPSSSEADVRGPAANRLVPAQYKVTFPLMGIQNDERYVALTWQTDKRCAALFDSPDRIFGSQGHTMALVFPGAEDSVRSDGQLVPDIGVKLPANQPLELRATILGGRGSSLAPALDQFVRMNPPPPLPAKPDRKRYVELTAAGWLDSALREGNQYRHAVWQGFGLQNAVDVSFYMDWLAAQTSDAELAERLTKAAEAARGQVPPAAWYDTQVSHVRLPIAPLLYGHVLENVETARSRGRAMLDRFEPDGRILYRAGKKDYGTTHYEPDADGLTAQVVESLLKAASFAGDRELVRQALDKLRALDRFRNDVPRGAQTWEVPLHTPDIMASAHLVNAYLIGFQITGDARFLQQARYWAWTGLPFVYLRNPTDALLGPYLTPPVFGATSWEAPVWMGLPVQWCGMVYADALFHLAPLDRDGPWQQLAEGITIAGQQVSWPMNDTKRKGLLPDIFLLREQHRDGPAINPGTVQSCAARLYGVPLYDFQVIREHGWLIHAPGKISLSRVTKNAAVFKVEGWARKSYYVLVNGVSGNPIVKINGTVADLVEPHALVDNHLVLQVAGEAKIEISTSPE